MRLSLLYHCKNAQQSLQTVEVMKFTPEKEDIENKNLKLISLHST